MTARQWAGTVATGVALAGTGIGAWFGAHGVVPGLPRPAQTSQSVVAVTVPTTIATPAAVASDTASPIVVFQNVPAGPVPVGRRLALWVELHSGDAPPVFWPGRHITYALSDTTVASLANVNGSAGGGADSAIVTGKRTGSVTLTATTESKTVGSVTLSFVPAGVAANILDWSLGTQGALPNTATTLKTQPNPDACTTWGAVDKPGIVVVNAAFPSKHAMVFQNGQGVDVVFGSVRTTTLYWLLEIQVPATTNNTGVWKINRGRMAGFGDLASSLIESANKNDVVFDYGTHPAVHGEVGTPSHYGPTFTLSDGAVHHLGGVIDAAHGTYTVTLDGHLVYTAVAGTSYRWPAGATIAIDQILGTVNQPPSRGPVSIDRIRLSTAPIPDWGR